MGAKEDESGPGEASVEDGTGDAVTVTSTVLTTVVVELGDELGDGRAEEGACVTVTTAVLTTVAVTTDTDTDTEGDGDDEGSETADELTVGLEDRLERGEVTACCATAPLPRTGVGTTVEFGLGGGNPDGYESWKMSSCAPSLKLYMSK